METKPFASLSSSLLARKGHAKPAMRPQGFGSLTPHEDLGWNDMGTGPAVLAPLPPVVAGIDVHEVHPVAPVPEVVRRQAEIAGELGITPEAEAAFPAPGSAPAPVPVLPVVPVSRARAGAKGKAAFTLRLDPERHLRLRLACAVSHRSAQVIVTEALDAFLNSVPGLDEIVRGAGKSIG